MTALTAAAAVGTATYYYATRSKPSAFGIDIENQSIIIDEKVIFYVVESKVKRYTHLLLVHIQAWIDSENLSNYV